ncbi:MAG: hypothetical protein ACTSRP_23830 [Candidatus Helarchaeota archaeon]
MKLLVSTRADKNIKELTDITHPLFRKYAKKWNADFLVLDEKYDAIDCPGLGRIHYRIFALKNLLEKYERILNLDSDMLINKNCPNPFEIVPYDKIGVVFEDKGSGKEERLRRFELIQQEFGYIGLKEGYINTGCILVSKIHKDIFQKINGRYYVGRGFDDVHIRYNIQKLGFEIYELPYKFNHQRKFSEKWNNYASRFDSFIIHYAGRGIYDKKDIFKKKIKSKIQQIKSDYLKIYGKLP